VRDKLMAGGSPNNTETNAMLKEFISRPICQTKGFILDIDMIYESQTPWATRILENDILGDREFTHVVELEAADEEIKLRSSNMKFDIDDGKVYSKWERAELAKPKFILNDEGELEEEPEMDPEDENYVKPLVESELVTRVCDESGPVTR